ncbi:MAG: hypothetical protein IJQ91_07470 [Acidaminococcaceae bacterium]|nr:hypothetical protein [Acidaminococcaceae bacterium]
MKLIKEIQGRVTKFVKKKGGVLPKLFVWMYAAAFLACGFITIFGIIYEFFIKNIINYKAVNDFIAAYFTPSICGTFALLGVLLIDRDQDGVPDKWQEKEGGDENGKDVSR